MRWAWDGLGMSRRVGLKVWLSPLLLSGSMDLVQALLYFKADPASQACDRNTSTWVSCVFLQKTSLHEMGCDFGDGSSSNLEVFGIKCFCDCGMSMWQLLSFSSHQDEGGASSIDTAAAWRKIWFSVQPPRFEKGFFLCRICMATFPALYSRLVRVCEGLCFGEEQSATCGPL